MKRYTDSQRRRMVQSFEGSGESAVAFCRRRGVSTVSLAQWRKRYGESPAEPGGAPQTGSPWLPVMLTGPSDRQTAEGGVLYVLISGSARLEVAAGFSLREVSQLWQLLGGGVPESDHTL